MSDVSFYERSFQSSMPAKGRVQTDPLSDDTVRSGLVRYSGASAFRKPDYRPGLDQNMID